MGKKRGRRGSGEGEIEQLPSGNYRARRSQVIGGELVRGGSETFETRKEAQEWLLGNQTPSPAGTVNEWLDQWLELIKPDRAPKTYFDYLRRSRKWIRPYIGTEKLRDLTGLSISTMLAKMAADDDASNGERHRVGRVLRTALKAAVAHNLIPQSPMDGIKLPAIGDKEKRAYTEVELATMLMAAKYCNREKVARWCNLEAVFRLWADAGLRPSELRALEWADIDLDKGVVKVKRSLDSITNKPKDTKTKGSRRTILLAPSTIASLLVARPHNQRLVMPDGDGGYYWENSFHRDVWKKVRKKAGLEWSTPYTFRHTMATLLLRSKEPVVPLKVVSERLGHANVTTTLKHYAHILDGDQDRAASVMEGVLNPTPHAIPTGGKNGRKTNTNP
jgi:integrase